MQPTQEKTPTQVPTPAAQVPTPTQVPTHYADQAFQLNNLQNCGVDRQKAYDTVMSLPLEAREVFFVLLKKLNC